MYEDSDEEHKPDGTEQANPETTKARIEAIKAKIIKSTDPIGGHQTRPPLRPVTVSQYYREEGETNYSIRVVGKGRFHQWGVDVDHSDFGSGTYSIAIVEMEDGTVQSVAIDLIKFEDQ